MTLYFCDITSLIIAIFLPGKHRKTKQFTQGHIWLSHSIFMLQKQDS